MRVVEADCAIGTAGEDVGGGAGGVGESVDYTDVACEFCDGGGGKGLRGRHGGDARRGAGWSTLAGRDIDHERRVIELMSKENVNTSWQA